MPYSKTLNDSRYLVAPGYSNPRDFAEDCRSAIDYMLDEADETGGRMLTIGIHARWMGQPNRASGLRDVIEHVQKNAGRRLHAPRGHRPLLAGQPCRASSGAPRNRGGMFETLISGRDRRQRRQAWSRRDVGIAGGRIAALCRPARRPRRATVLDAVGHACCCPAWSTRMRICASPA